MPQRSVMIVEDEQIVAMDLQQTLQEYGYSVTGLAATADAAVAMAAARLPDVVLMDIRIHGERDGIDAACALRERFGVPVIFLTAHADDSTIDRAKKAEPLGYLVKPVKPAELHSVVEIALYRNALERRLREEERWHKTTLRSIADAVVTVDIDGAVSYMNPAAETLVGLPLADALGRPAKDVLRIDTDVEEGVLPIVRALREGPVTLPAGLLFNHSTGGRRLIADSAAPVADDAHILGAVMVFRDVTEEAAARKHAELTDRLASLGTLAAGVAHEINNPLASALANVEYIGEELQRNAAKGAGAVDAELLAALSDARTSLERIGRIVADLRIFGRPPEPAGSADVDRCVRWALEVTTHETRHRAVVDVDVEPGLRAAVDDARLGQLLVNLIVNAAHAIPTGHAAAHRIGVHIARVGKDLQLTVSDTGVGMSEQTRARIFEPFFTTKDVGSGTGLGLSIVHGILRACGGAIDVDSVPGRGTQFRVRLPAALPTPAATPAPTTLPTQRRARILIVDDEPSVGRAIERILQGHDVKRVTQAAAAVQLLQSGEHFDVIFSDVLMPQMSGIEFYEWLLKNNPTLAPQVVFMTGGVDETVSSFLAAVPNKRISKPFAAEALRTAIAELT